MGRLERSQRNGATKSPPYAKNALGWGTRATPGYREKPKTQRAQRKAFNRKYRKEDPQRRKEKSRRFMQKQYLGHTGTRKDSRHKLGAPRRHAPGDNWTGPGLHLL